MLITALLTQKRQPVARAVVAALQKAKGVDCIVDTDDTKAKSKKGKKKENFQKDDGLLSSDEGWCTE